ncbi:hypothetical protein BDV95DRAFT_297646 [Massariosphaeria phaeospora]|uniref:Uncharacterized protein n=1 Tax=Massariosphaeria phaeospora TaxID=100035 RepID=A0A7C8MEM8_9PLEO|nr:hypothetical protein BDV95DRAFT_297646 [Massariosphaeria phaeospora]
MRLPASTLSLAVFCLFCSWTQAYLISAETCSAPTITLIVSSMKRIADAVDIVMNGISKPQHKSDDTTQKLYKGATEASFHALSENARQMFELWVWTYQKGGQGSSLAFNCREACYVPASDSAGNEWKIAGQARVVGAKSALTGPSYRAANPPRERTLCGPNDMIQTLSNTEALVIVLCPRIRSEIRYGRYRANKDMEYGQYLKDNLNNDYLVREIFRALYMKAFSEHTAAIDANTGWAEAERMPLDKALTNFYSFAYHALALYFTIPNPESFFLDGYYIDSEAINWGEDCEINLDDLPDNL